MKRFAPYILALAVFAGVLAPVTATIAPNQGIAVHTQSAYAQSGPTPTEIEGTTPITGNKAISDEMDSCGVLISGTLVGCLENILYFIPYTIGGWLLHFSAWVFDSTAALTLSSVVYSGSSFISDGWRLTRDFANIFLILILLFAALSIVLDIEIGHADPKKLLAPIILVAIMLNFSMFLTEVVIDTSNSLALVFYNQITLTDKNGNTTGTSDPASVPSGTVAPKSISAALVTAFEPGILQSRSFWEQMRGGATRTNTNCISAGAAGATIGTVVPGIGTAIGGIVGCLSGFFVFTSESKTVPASVIISVLILVGVMYLVAAWSFFIAALSFVGRLVGLWMAIIFAPIAFVTYIIPSMRHLGDFTWSGWLKSLITLSFAAPIYFFFLLIISLMAKSSVVSSIMLRQGNSLEILVIIFISFMFLIVMLMKATKYVKGASGEIGQMAVNIGTSLVQGAGSLALGAAAGGIAFAGRRTLGAKAMRFAEDEGNRDMASGRVTTETKRRLLAVNPHLDLAGKSPEDIKNMSEFQALQTDARRKVEKAQKTAAKSYDFRQTGIGGTFRKATGMDMNSFGVLSLERAAGGYEGERNYRATKDNAFKKKLAYNHDQLNAFEDTIDDREVALIKEQRNLKAATEKLKNDFSNKDKENGGTTAYNTAKGEKEALEKKVYSLQNGHPTIPLDVKDIGSLISIRGIDGEEVAKHTVTQEDVTNKKTTTSYFQEHIDKHVKKADGEPVDIVDVSSGATETSGLSLQKLNKMMERTKNDRVKSFDHMTLAKKDFVMHGALLDSTGNIIRTGHLDLDTRKNQAKDYLAAFKISKHELSNSTGVVDTMEKMLNVLRYGVVGAVHDMSKELSNIAVLGERKLDASGANLAATGHAHDQGKPLNPTLNVNVSAFTAGGGHSGGHDSGHDSGHDTSHGHDDHSH